MKIVYLISFFLFTGLLTACGIQPETATNIDPTATESPTIAPTNPPTNITLRVGTGDSGDGLIPHQTIIDRFEAENPNIQVELEPITGRDYYANLFAAIADGTAPDIMNIGDDAVPQFVDSGAFLPLDSYIDSENGLDLSIYVPGVLEPGQHAGRQYFLPKDYSTLGVFYNKRIFDEYDVPYPQTGWTWADFKETATALTHDTDGDGETDVWGVQMAGAWTSGFEYWVAAAGGQLISPDGQSFIDYLDSPETVEAIEFYADLYRTGVTPPPADMNAFGSGNTEFSDGQAAMQMFGRWPQTSFIANPEIDLGVVGVPQHEERVNILFWGGFGIYSDTEHPDVAWEFLKFYAGVEGAETWKNWALPAVSSVAEEAGLNDDPLESVWLAELNYLTPRAYIYTPYWSQIADPAVREILEIVILRPEADSAEVARNVADEAQFELEAIQ